MEICHSHNIARIKTIPKRRKKKMKTKICTDCGNESKEKYCPNCGKELKKFPVVLVVLGIFAILVILALFLVPRGTNNQVETVISQTSTPNPTTTLPTQTGTAIVMATFAPPATNQVIMPGQVQWEEIYSGLYVKAECMVQKKLGLCLEGDKIEFQATVEGWTYYYTDSSGSEVATPIEPGVHYMRTVYEGASNFHFGNSR